MGAMFLMELVHFLLPLWVLCCLNPPIADAACTWPEPFAGDVWEDSTHGDLTFGDTDMTGWDFTVLGQTRDSWQCVRVDRYHSDGYMIMVTTATFRAFQSDWYAYLCLKLTRITEVSYRYYEMSEIQDARGAYERVYIDVTDTITDIDTLCSESVGATGPEYQVLIKSRREGEAKQICGAPLLATFDYVHTASDGISTCARSSDTWDVCTDRQVMTFNYTSCSTKVAYSASGAVWCVASVTSSDGSAVYTTVYNHLDATVNNADTYRFSCFAVNTAGTMSSVAKQHCRRGHTPESVPSDNSFPANAVGATLTMPTIYARCPLEEEKAGSGVNGGAIAGGVVGGLVFVAIATVASVLAFRHWATSRKGEPRQTSVAETARTRTGGVTSRSIAVSVDMSTAANTANGHALVEHVSENKCETDTELDSVTKTNEPKKDIIRNIYANATTQPPVENTRLTTESPPPESPTSHITTTVKPLPVYENIENIGTNHTIKTTERDVIAPEIPTPNISRDAMFTITPEYPSHSVSIAPVNCVEPGSESDPEGWNATDTEDIIDNEEPVNVESTYNDMYDSMLVYVNGELTVLDDEIAKMGRDYSPDDPNPLVPPGFAESFNKREQTNDSIIDQTNELPSHMAATGSDTVVGYDTSIETNVKLGRSVNLTVRIPAQENDETARNDEYESYETDIENAHFNPTIDSFDERLPVTISRGPTSTSLIPSNTVVDESNVPTGRASNMANSPRRQLQKENTDSGISSPTLVRNTPMTQYAHMYADKQGALSRDMTRENITSEKVKASTDYKEHRKIDSNTIRITTSTVRPQSADLLRSKTDVVVRQRPHSDLPRRPPAAANTDRSYNIAGSGMSSGDSSISDIMKLSTSFAAGKTSRSNSLLVRESRETYNLRMDERNMLYREKEMKLRTDIEEFESWIRRNRLRSAHSRFTSQSRYMHDAFTTANK